MKRQAGAMSVHETTVPQCKRPRRANHSLPSREQSSTPFQLAGKEHTIIARLQIKNDPEHTCVKRIHAIFDLQAVGRINKPTEIGYLYGQTIDRSVTGHYKPEQPLFISEMLNNRSVLREPDRPMKHSTGKEIDETEIIMQHIFHRDGTPREDFSRKFLGQRPKLHFIAEFQLCPVYRGCGLAKVAMHTYLRGIQRFDGCHRFRGTVLLSPAALPQREDASAAASASGPVKSLVEIEHALIASYERAGFKVWSKGDDSLEGSAITIMGLRLTGPKIARVSTRPLLPGDVATGDMNLHILPTKRVDSGF